MMARIPRRGFCLGALSLGAALLVGCGRSADPSGPPEIRYGLDTCAHCGMLIDDPAHAAAYRTAQGQARLFDDVSHMVLYSRERQETVAGFYVHDYNTRAWLKAEAATYVDSPRVRSAMGDAVVALASEADARSLVERLGGRTLTFQEVMARADAPKVAGHGH